MRTLLVWTVLIVFLAGCRPATYDLTVRVTETDGTAIPQASVTLLKLREAQTTDAAGETTWRNLETDAAVLFVAADGYVAHAGRVELERGHNERIVQLERAPAEPDVLNP